MKVGYIREIRIHLLYSIGIYNIIKKIFFLYTKPIIFFDVGNNLLFLKFIENV